MNCRKRKYKKVSYVPIVLDLQGEAIGFKNWIKNIIYKDGKIILPDGTIIRTDIFLFNTGQFDYRSYTNFLRNTYEGN